MIVDLGEGLEQAGQSVWALHEELSAQLRRNPPWCMKIEHLVPEIPWAGLAMGRTPEMMASLAVSSAFAVNLVSFARNHREKLHALYPQLAAASARPTRPSRCFCVFHLESTKVA